MMPRPSREGGRRLSRSLAIVTITLATLAGVRVQAEEPATAAQDPLRVCADPNNLPFSNARGICGDYREASPPSRLIKGVERGEVDVAAVWGRSPGTPPSRSRAERGHPPQARLLDRYGVPLIEAPAVRR
jgi:hypothetical protein